jgi:hypothetical protein
VGQIPNRTRNRFARLHTGTMYSLDSISLRRHTNGVERYNVEIEIDEMGTLACRWPGDLATRTATTSRVPTQTDVQEHNQENLSRNTNHNRGANQHPSRLGTLLYRGKVRAQQPKFELENEISSRSACSLSNQPKSPSRIIFHPQNSAQKSESEHA